MNVAMSCTGQHEVAQQGVAASWRARGFSCAVWTDAPGQVWADFVHPTDELVMLIEGHIELTFNGQTLCPDVGEEILIPAGVRHTVRNPGNTTSRWYYEYKDSSEAP